MKENSEESNAPLGTVPIGKLGCHWTKRSSVGEVRVVTSTHCYMTRRKDPNENPGISNAAIEEIER